MDEKTKELFDEWSRVNAKLERCKTWLAHVSGMYSDRNILVIEAKKMLDEAQRSYNQLCARMAAEYPTSGD